MSDIPKEQVYYGWKIVFAILVMLTFSSGLSFYNHSIYLNALAASPAFDIESASTAVSLFFLSGGFAGLQVAKLVQRYDPRYCIVVGAVLAATAISLLPSISNLTELFAVYILFGAGFAGSALIPATTLVTRWFQRRRAMALSIASTGLSVGGVVVTPLSVLMVDRLGFALAAPLMGLMFLLGVIPVALIYLRPDPAAMGLAVDGGPVAPALNPTDLADGQAKAPAQPPPVEDGISFSEARRGRFFWCVSTAYVFLMMAQVGGIAHQYGLAREQLNEAQTAIAVAILPVASIVGRLIGGWVVDNLSIRSFAMFMMVVQAAALAVLAEGFSPLSLCVGLFLFGATVGNLLMLQPLLIADAFGLRDYARIFSVANLMTSFGTAIGPALLGFAYSYSGGFYRLPYWLAATAGVMGFVLFLSGGKWDRQETT